MSDVVRTLLEQQALFDFQYFGIEVPAERWLGRNQSELIYGSDIRHALSGYGAGEMRIVPEINWPGNKNWLSGWGLGKMPVFTGAGAAMAGKSQKTLGFESAMAELEQIVADMEAGKLSLEDSLAAYKRGAELLSFCRSRLEDAQQQVRVLEDGMLKDFDVGQATSTGSGQA